MHNEYITLRCIRDEKDKLLLLKYENVDITNIRKILQELTLDLMEQCYNHVKLFNEHNKRNTKNYVRLEPIINEQLDDMGFIKRKFIEYFTIPGFKTKADLLIYVLAFQIPINYYNEYLYAVIFESLKRDYTDEYWKKYNLNRFELDTNFTSEYCIQRKTDHECSTGQINISLNNGVNIIDTYARDKDEKLGIAKGVGNILDNYYNSDFPILNNPYNEYTVDLVDHIKVYNDFEKPKQLIKRT
jgi:hypothetical protein